jgi:hypothetical protein
MGFWRESTRLARILDTTRQCILVVECADADLVYCLTMVHGALFCCYLITLNHFRERQMPSHSW